MTNDTDRFWLWSKTKGPDGGAIRITDRGLVFEVDDDFYNGELSREVALDLARAILARYGDRND